MADRATKRMHPGDAMVGIETLHQVFFQRREFSLK